MERHENDPFVSKHSICSLLISLGFFSIEVSDRPQEEEPLDSFLVSIDPIPSLTNVKNFDSSSKTFPTGLRTFNTTPSSMIRNIYESLRITSNDPTTLQLTDLFISIDHELCVMKNSSIRKY